MAAGSKQPPPQHDDLAEHLDHITHPSDPWLNDTYNLLVSVLAHLYHWFDHVRAHNTPVTYLREALTVIGPGYLSTLGHNPQRAHTQLLQDIRVALNNMINNVTNGMPYHTAANTGPHLQGRPPTYLVDPSLLLQLAHQSLRLSPNAQFHELPTSMLLYRLQVYFGLRNRFVPNIPEIKSAPPPDNKALPAPAPEPQPEPAPKQPAPPPPKSPWPAQHQPAPCPPAPCQQQPPVKHPPPAKPMVKETTTITYTTTRYYEAFNAGPQDEDAHDV